MKTLYANFLLYIIISNLVVTIEAFDIQTTADSIDIINKAFRYSGNLSNQLEDTQKIFEELNQNGTCVNNPGKGKCLQNGCVNSQSCVNTIIKNLSIFLDKLGKIFIGNITKDESAIIYSPGIVMVLLDLVAKLPVMIPEDQWPSKKDTSKFYALTAKVGNLSQKMSLLALKLQDMQNFFKSLRYQIDGQIPPEKLSEPVSLPKIEFSEAAIHKPVNQQNIPDWKRTLRNIEPVNSYNSLGDLD